MADCAMGKPFTLRMDYQTVTGCYSKFSAFLGSSNSGSAGTGARTGPGSHNNINSKGNIRRVDE